MKMFTLRLGIALGMLATITLRADVVTQDFEAFPAVDFFNGPNHVQTNGWTINDVLVQTEAISYLPPKSGTKVAWLPDSSDSGIANPTNSYIETPPLTNGIGAVTYYLYNSQDNLFGPYTCQLQINTNGSWNTIATIDNTGNTGWIGYTNTINYYGPARLRWFRSTTLADYSWLGVDAISTTEAPTKVDVSDLVISPVDPRAGESVTVSALIESSAQAVVSARELLWSADGGASNTISMVRIGSTDRYQTGDPIPSQAAFTEIDYTVQVTFSGPGAQSPATASGRFFFREAPPQSAYSNVTVNGDLPGPLQLVEDDYWTAAQSVAARGTTDVYFVSDDGATTTPWRDPTPSQTVLPLAGGLAAGAGSIRIDSIDAGWLLYSFDETDATYAIEQAVYQSFDSWTTVGSYTTTTIDGWSLTSVRAINDALALSGYSLQFQDTTSERALAAPALTNGIGFIQFQYRNTQTNGLSPAAFAIQTKAASGDAWSTQATVTDIISPDYLFYRLPINRFDWKYIRVVATGPATGQLLIDNLAVSTLEYPADVTIVSHGISPASPRADEAVTFFAQVEATAPTTSTNATVQLNDGGSPLGTPLTLAYNSGSGRLEATLPTNLPALVAIDYTLTVSFTGPHASILSPKTATGDFYLRAPLPTSPYSGVSLAGDLVNALALATNGFWAGVVPVGALSNLSVYFESVNGTTNQWNDSAPTRTSLPVFGEFALSTNAADDITIDATDSGWLLATFDENSGRYGIQQTDYQSFNSSAWNLGIAGTYTVESWTLRQGLTTTAPALIFEGRSVQFANTTAERAIESPELTNGIGTIAFRYRNTVTNLLSPAAFVIQVRPTTGVGWTTVDTVTGIVSPDYIYHNFTVASVDLRYIRIAATNGMDSAQLLIDDIIVTRPGATVSFDSRNHTPTDPDVTILDLVDVTINVNPLNGAVLNSVNLRFRGGDSGIYDSIAMTHTSGNQYTGTIPRGARGQMQYYVEASYLDPATGGDQTANDPLDRTGMSAVYTNSDVTLATQDFEAFPAVDFSNGPNHVQTNGWIINDVLVQTEAISYLPPKSGTKVAWLPDSSDSGIANPTNSYIETPPLTNGIGAVTYYLYNSQDNLFGPYTCQLQINTNGSWNTIATIDNTGNTGWIGYTNTINYYGPARLRWFRSTTLNNYSWLGVDAISITYPPAYVTASAFDLQPAYPSQEEPATVSCTIESATTFHTAFNISGTLWYRVNDQVTGWTAYTPVGMTRNGSRFDADIPAQLNLSEVEYYVAANFKGYSAMGEDQSPMPFPDAPLGYATRRYESAFSNVSIRVDGADVTSFNQLGNGMWEGVLEFIDPTNMPTFLISGFGYYDGTTASSGFFGTWGDNIQYRTNMPLEGTATLGGSEILIPETNAVGQYIIRFDENTGIYSVQRAAVQDFEDWPADDTYFGESYAAAQITQYEQSFDAWPQTEYVTPTEDFESGWTNVFDYPDNWSINSGTQTDGDSRSYLIRGGIVVTQAVGQAALLKAGVTAHVRNNNVGKRDAGSFSFDLRCASPDDFSPAIHPGVTSTNIRIEAKIMTTDVPTNSTSESYGYAYKSIIGNYFNADNYYEGRVRQISATQIRYELWEINGGTATQRGTSQTVTSSIKTEHTVQLNFYWTGTNTVKIRLTGSGKTINYDDASATPAAYGFGFNGMDAALSIEDVSVYAVTNSSFAINPTAVYTESFDSTPTDWDITDNWTVSGGRFIRPGYVGTPIEARVQFSTDLDTWTTSDIFTNLTHSYYKRYTGYPHNANLGYVRVLHESGSGYLIIDNVVRTSWAGANLVVNGWEGKNVWVDDIGKSGRGIELRHSRAAGGASQEIWSPVLTRASVIEFDYKAADTNVTSVAFVIDYLTNDPEVWTALAAPVTRNSGLDDWQNYSASIPRDLQESITRLRIRNQTAGNDDGLVIDNLTVTEPVSLEDTTTWWGYNVLVTSTQPNGANAIIATEDSPWLARVAGNRFGAFLNNSATNGTGGVTNNEYNPFIQSATLPDGVGEIRFLYRAWDTNASEIEIVGTASTNRLLAQSEWKRIGPLVSVTNTVYQEYYYAAFERDYRYVALRVNSQDGHLGRVGVDNIVITAPLAADLRLSELELEPVIPTFNDDVFVKVKVDDFFFSPSNIVLKLLYKAGDASWGDYTNGTWTVVDMEDDDEDGIYRSEFPIVKKPIDQVVQYQVKAEFQGFFSEKSSPKYYNNFVNPEHYRPIDLNDGQADQTPYYYSLSCLPGQVWINELNITDDSTWLSFPAGQYVELVGWGNANMANWRLEVINPVGYSTNATYTFTNNFTIGNETDQFHFYTFGQPDVLTANRELTNALPYSGGLQLVRPTGIIDEQVSYDTYGYSSGLDMSLSTDPNHKFVYAGLDDDLYDYSLSRHGTGSTRMDFVSNWVDNAEFSVGTTNFDAGGSIQTLIVWPTNDIPVVPGSYTGEVIIVSAVLSNLSGRVYFNANAEEASLIPSVWYVTNLLNVTSNDWQQRTEDFGYNAAGTNYEVWCQQVTPPVFYRIGMNVAP